MFPRLGTSSRDEPLAVDGGEERPHAQSPVADTRRQYREIDPARLKAIGIGILGVLADVRSAVEDAWGKRPATKVLVTQLR